MITDHFTLPLLFQWSILGENIRFQQHTLGINTWPHHSSHQPMMMEIETRSETLDTKSTFTWLIFITCRRPCNLQIIELLLMCAHELIPNRIKNYNIRFNAQ